MDLEGKTELSGDELAQSLVDKVGGVDNFVSGKWGNESNADTSDEPAADDAPETTDKPAAETVEAEEPVYTEDAQGNLHGPDGKFVEKDQRTGDEQIAEAETGDTAPAGDADVATADEDVITLEIDDPELASLLDKYDGDIEKTLRAHLDLQKLHGRQTNEVGDYREVKQQLEELKSMVERGSQPHVDVESALARIVNADLEDEPDGEARRTAAFQQLADRVASTGDYDEVGRVVAEWKEFDPFSASMYATSLINEFQREAMAEQFAQAQNTEATPTDDDVAKEVAKVVERHPDIQKFLPQIGEIAKQRPYLDAVLQNGSPAERAQALEDLYQLARAGDADTSREAIKRVQIRTQSETDKAKADAAVVSGGRSSAASADQPTAAEDFKQRFRKAAGLPEDLEIV